MQALILLLATAAFVAAPAVTPPFTGYAPGTFPVLIKRPAIQPAGYAFSIWGVIYLWLLISAVAGFWQRGNAAWSRPFLPHLAALILGTLWLAIASGYPILAAVVITTMAACTLWAFLSADPRQNRWLQQAPLGLFASWLTAATCVTWGILLGGYGWLSDTSAALAMLALALAIAITVQSRRPGMPTYSAAVIWASVGVAVVNWQDLPLIAWAALAGALILTTSAALLLRRQLQFG